MQKYIHPARFDFMAKYLYIKYKDKGFKTNFHKELYHKHIVTFNGCYEYPDPTIPGCGITKKCIEDFFNVFNNLIDDMKKNGFNEKFSIPLGKNNIIINGTHRLLTAYYYNIKPSYKLLNKKGDEYNYHFFLYRKGNPKLNRLYTDTMALEYIKHNPNIRCMILYPVAYNKEKIMKILNIIKQYGYIYYAKQVKLNSNGVDNLIKEMYRGEEWIGGLFPTLSGSKHRLCYTNNPILYISIAMNDITKCVELKEKCRLLYKFGKHSLHMSDYTKDTWRISSSLLNTNSIHYLNKGNSQITPNTQKLLGDYFKEVEPDKEDYCLTSSLIIEMYGLRAARDIDYLHVLDKQINLNNIGVHHDKWLTYYNVHKDDIIYNPKNHFYFNGFKFATLNIVKNMKLKRNEPKDILDIRKINRVI